jgi:hypothetical protein
MAPKRLSAKTRRTHKRVHLLQASGSAIERDMRRTNRAFYAHVAEVYFWWLQASLDTGYLGTDLFDIYSGILRYYKLLTGKCAVGVFTYQHDSHLGKLLIKPMPILYTNKIPAAVRDGMSQLTANDCFLIKRRTKGLTGEGIQRNCHFNVQNWVDKIGGERLCGWLLCRNRSLMSDGVWVWSFHSVWKTPEEEVVDVTQDKTYDGADFTTVWLDKSRDIDLIEGTSYNNVVVFETNTAAKTYTKHSGIEVFSGIPYWITPNMQTALPIADHSGKYRWLNSTFPNNIKLLESEYNCKLVEGRFIPNEGASGKVSINVAFDYSVSIR